MSESTTAPRIAADDVSVRFLIRYHRSEVTLRETFVRMADRVAPRNGRAHGWSQEFWALKNIRLEAAPGDVIGLIGRNGSGKTTLLKTLAGIIGADRGTIEVRGTVGCLLSFGVGFRPNLTGRENVFINGSVLGLSEKDIAARLDRIIEFSELGDFIDAPVQTYSAGMRGRLGFSIAIHIDPDILVLDEVLTTGDLAFRKKAGNVLDSFRSEHKIVVAASHDLEFIRNICTRAVWLDQGEIRMSGPPAEVTKAYGEFSAKVAG